MTILDNLAQAPFNAARPRFDWTRFYKAFGASRQAGVACQAFLIESDGAPAVKDTLQLAANLAVPAAVRGRKTLHVDWAGRTSVDSYDGRVSGAGMQHLLVRYAQQSALTADDLLGTVVELGECHHVLAWPQAFADGPDGFWWPDNLRGDRQADFLAALMTLLRSTYDVVLVDIGARAGAPLLFDYLWPLAHQHILSACKGPWLTLEPGDTQLREIEAWVAERLALQAKPPMVVLRLGPPNRTLPGSRGDSTRRQEWWVNFPYCISDAELSERGFVGLESNAWWTALQAVARSSALRKATWLLMPQRDDTTGMSAVEGAPAPLVIADRYHVDLEPSAARLASCYTWLEETLWPRR